MTLMYALAGTATSGWLSARTMVGVAACRGPATAFVLIERRDRQPLVPPHTWKVAPW